MDQIKNFISGLLGGDGNLDINDLKGQIGDIGLNDLQSLSFPISKEEIVNTLTENGSSDALIQAVEKLPEGTFDSLSDLRNKLPF